MTARFIYPTAYLLPCILRALNPILNKTCFSPCTTRDSEMELRWPRLLETGDFTTKPSHLPKVTPSQKPAKKSVHTLTKNRQIFFQVAGKILHGISLPDSPCQINSWLSQLGLCGLPSFAEVPIVSPTHGPLLLSPRSLPSLQHSSSQPVECNPSGGRTTPGTGVTYQMPCSSTPAL